MTDKGEPTKRIDGPQTLNESNDVPDDEEGIERSIGNRRGTTHTLAQRVAAGAGVAFVAGAAVAPAAIYANAPTAEESGAQPDHGIRIAGQDGNAHAVKVAAAPDDAEKAMPPEAAAKIAEIKSICAAMGLDVDCDVQDGNLMLTINNEGIDIKGQMAKLGADPDDFDFGDNDEDDDESWLDAIGRKMVEVMPDDWVPDEVTDKIKDGVGGFVDSKVDAMQRYYEKEKAKVKAEAGITAAEFGKRIIALLGGIIGLVVITGIGVNTGGFQKLWPLIGLANRSDNDTDRGHAVKQFGRGIGLFLLVAASTISPVATCYGTGLLDGTMSKVADAKIKERIDEIERRYEADEPIEDEPEESEEGAADAEEPLKVEEDDDDEVDEDDEDDEDEDDEDDNKDPNYSF